MDVRFPGTYSYVNSSPPSESRSLRGPDGDRKCIGCCLPTHTKQVRYTSPVTSQVHSLRHTTPKGVHRKMHRATWLCSIQCSRASKKCEMQELMETLKSFMLKRGTKESRLNKFLNFETEIRWKSRDTIAQELLSIFTIIL